MGPFLKFKQLSLEKISEQKSRKLLSFAIMATKRQNWMRLKISRQNAPPHRSKPVSHDVARPGTL